MRIGIIGNGFVGKATSIMECPDVEIIVYDIVPSMCKPVGITLHDICDCDLIFVSVPTPMNTDGSCHLDILKNVVSEIKKIKSLDEVFLVNRCTVSVGTSDQLGCYFMPEFLTEKNFNEDFRKNPDWIFGLKGTETDSRFKEKIEQLINFSHKHGCIESNQIHFVNNKEAEMIKLFRNNFLSTKIAFCNEIYQFTKIHSVDYETVRELATRDPRIGASHTRVPGHDGKFGYGGTCFPKDTNNLLHHMKESNMESYLIKATVERNENVDRKEQDWKLDNGRAVINK